MSPDDPAGKVTAKEYWRARLESGEIPAIESSFTMEEQLRILHTRAKDLEKRLVRIEAIVYGAILLGVIGFIIALVVLSIISF